MATAVPRASAPAPLAASARRALRLFRRLGFEYACYHVYSLPLDAPRTPIPLPASYRFAELTIEDVHASSVEALRDCDAYAGRDAHVFGVFGADGTLACVQCIWYGERYAAQAYWPIERNAAVSVHLVTAPEQRNKGFATLVKEYSAVHLREAGFKRLYSRIWWTNAPSLRVSEKAGWARVGTLVELKLPARGKPVVLSFRRGRSK
ncbi:MAG: GNAT family protein [Burkholderiales bacterium]